MKDLVQAVLNTWSGKKLSRIAPVARTQGQQTVAGLLLDDRESCFTLMPVLWSNAT